MAKFTDDRCLGAAWGQRDDLYRFKDLPVWLLEREAISHLQDHGFTVDEAKEYLQLLKAEYIAVYMGDAEYES